MNKYIAIVFVLILTVIACKTKKVVKNEVNTDNKTVKTDQVDIEEDTTSVVVLSPKEFYTKTCGNCHDLYAPGDYNAEQWKVNLNNMQERAMITDANKATLYTYLTSGKTW